MMERYKINVPWALKQLGARKWLSERALHMPERYIEGWCVMLSNLTGADITPERWRQVEARLVQLLYDGIVITEYPT